MAGAPFKLAEGAFYFIELQIHFPFQNESHFHPCLHSHGTSDTSLSCSQLINYCPHFNILLESCLS